MESLYERIPAQSGLEEQRVTALARVVAGEAHLQQAQRDVRDVQAAQRAKERREEFPELRYRVVRRVLREYLIDP